MIQSTDPPPLKKVVIHEQPDPSTQFDSTYSLACLVCCSASSALPSSVPCLDDQDVRTKAWVQRIVHSTPSAQQQSEMKQWEEQVTMCEHTLCLTQEPPPAEQRGVYILWEKWASVSQIRSVSLWGLYVEGEFMVVLNLWKYWLWKTPV